MAKVITIFLLLSLSTQCFAKQNEKQQLEDYYKYWKSKYLKKSKQVQGGMFLDYNENQTTCSEAHGYAMLISLQMSQFNDKAARKDFDALNTFRKKFKSEIDSRLMAWYVDDKKARHKNTTCATDGDLDMAYALILASQKWKSPKYMKEAKVILKGIEKSLVRPDYSLRRGDWDTEQHAIRLSDIMPAHFDLFAQVSNRKLWQNVKKTHYEILRKVAQPHGVFPDFMVKGKQGWKPAPPNLLESKYDGMMYYNACRVPWRLAVAAIDNNDQEAIRLLKVFNRGIGKVSNDQFMAGFRLSGKPLNDWTDGAFTAPHMCSLYVNNRKSALQTAIKSHFKEHDTYFPDTLCLLSLCLVTNNRLVFKREIK